MQELYKSDVSAAIHETAQGLYEHALLMRRACMNLTSRALRLPPWMRKG